MTRTAPRGRSWRQPTALAVAVLMMLPVFAIPANAQLFHRNPASPAPPKKGMSTGKKVALVAGAALLYYLYKRHQAAMAAQQPAATTMPQQGATAASAANGQHAQLYRSKNGGIYYRDAQGKPVWLTVPNKPVEVSTDDLQRYAPDYQKYSGPAPTAPAGYRTQPFTDLMSAATNAMTHSAPGPGGH